jgi:hypothetical protein
MIILPKELKKINVFNERTLRKYNNDITEEVETKRKKMIKHQRFYFSLLISAFIGICFLPILLYGYFYPEIDIELIIIIWGIFDLMCLFTIRSAKKQYKRLRHDYIRVEAKARMNHEVNYALKSADNPKWEKPTRHEFNTDVVVDIEKDDNGKRIFKPKMVSPHRKQPLTGSYPDNEEMKKIKRLFEDDNNNRIHTE